jgi:2-dehydropantoate 2-reductase
VPSTLPPSRVLVAGIGGIGGTLAGGLALHAPEIAAEVLGYTPNQAIAAAVNRVGYQLSGPAGEQVVPGRVLTELPAPGPHFDLIFLATQPPQVEDAARAAQPLLAPGGALVVLQNGLCEERVARIVGEDAVIGCIVGWGASAPEPGRFERTSEGGFTIGRLDGQEDARLRRLALLLEMVGPVVSTPNLRGARWSKLALNCAVSTLGTLGGDRLGALMPYLVVRRLALHLMTETVQVAAASGVRLEPVSGTFDLDWLALREDEAQAALGTPALVAKHALLLAVGARYRRLRSSMLSAIERGRPPAVDFLNGEVADRGAALGVPTPVNAAARRFVHEIAAGRRAPGLRTVRRLATEVGLQVGPFTGGEELPEDGPEPPGDGPPSTG